MYSYLSRYILIICCMDCSPVFEKENSTDRNCIDPIQNRNSFTIQCFLKRCNKRRYTSELINIYDLLEKCDRRLFTKIKNNVNHLLYALLPKVKESSKKLRSQTSQLPRINTERFKNCYFNRIRFQYNLAI